MWLQRLWLKVVYIPFHFMVDGLNIFLLQMKRARHICPYNIMPPLLLGSNHSFILCNRARRRLAREQSGKMADHLEGLSSDDEETSTDTTNFNIERG